MKMVTHSMFTAHQTGVGHAERPDRMRPFAHLPDRQFRSGKYALESVHAPAYIDWVAQSSRQVGRLDNDTVVGPGSFEVACYAVGAAIEASKTGDFAVVRPPGHHAHADKAAGFCLFNNIAVATQQLVNAGKKVFIFDFDGHHGDGTEAIFYESPRVFFASTHQSPAYPGTGAPQDIGRQAGEGFTLNLPLPPGAGDDLLRKAWATILPYAKAFAPDVVAISAGFDAHQDDPLLQLAVSDRGFYDLGRDISVEFGGRMFAVLEGGYKVGALGRSVENFVAGVNGGQIVHASAPSRTLPEGQEVFRRGVERVDGLLRRVWIP